jgi:hypothetical protein
MNWKTANIRYCQARARAMIALAEYSVDARAAGQRLDHSTTIPCQQGGQDLSISSS